VVARQRSAEEWVAELDGIIDQYRNGEPRAAPLTRRQVIAGLVKLGVSEGDAVHYLDQKPNRPASGIASIGRGAPTSGATHDFTRSQ
jgi:hypothetical protein